jgi:hypothetical protein
MVSRAIGVPADKWWGIDRGGSNAVRTGMKTLLDARGAEKGLGILSTDITDDERANLRVLAFKGRGATCGYLPDSTANSLDKRNVRDGHPDDGRGAQRGRQRPRHPLRRPAHRRLVARRHHRQAPGAQVRDAGQTQQRVGAVRAAHVERLPV